MKTASLPANTPANLPDPRLESRGYSKPPPAPPDYWGSDPLVLLLSRNIAAEFSPGISWLFPRAHLIRYDFDPAGSRLKLQFPLRTLAVELWTPAQAGWLMDEVVRGTVSVLLAWIPDLKSRLPADISLTHDVSSPHGAPFEGVARVKKMKIEPSQDF